MRYSRLGHGPGQLLDCCAVSPLPASLYLVHGPGQLIDTGYARSNDLISSMYIALEMADF
jgi:hypothetical protein